LAGGISHGYLRISFPAGESAIGYERSCLVIAVKSANWQQGALEGGLLCSRRPLAAGQCGLWACFCLQGFCPDTVQAGYKADMHRWVFGGQGPGKLMLAGSFAGDFDGVYKYTCGSDIEQ